MVIRASYDSFRDLRESGSYYVDKTELIEAYLLDHFEKAVLFARPRRFGKTLTMTMFKDFLDIRQDSRDIFKGLKIMESGHVVEAYMNRYPVIFFSLKEVFGDSFSMVLQNFRIVISELFEEYSFLLESDKISEVSKDLFQTIWQQKGEQPNTEQALDLLCRMLRQYFDKPVFVLIDEYDVPMAKALGTDYYDKVRDMVEHMLSYVCKTNDNVKAVILSGCLYTVKNSTYTGVNNIIPYTVLSPGFASYIGFTEEDVKKLLSDAKLEDRYETVADWYDGYLFGREKMFCPWDVLCYVRSLLDGSYSEAMGPESYWINTSETTLDIIHGFLGKTAEANERFEQLLAGKSIQCTVNEHLPYHQIHASGENIWSALLETGYLTKTVKEKMPRMPLRIPNKEIQVVFRREVCDYFENRLDNRFVSSLEKSLWQGDVSEAEAALGLILEATLSFYHEYHEYSYHLILDGFFTGLGYRVLSETETGYGRSDLIILDPAAKRCMILELKHVQNEAGLESAAQDAEEQIVSKKYEDRLIYDGYETRLKYAMAFWGRKVIIKVGR